MEAGGIYRGDGGIAVVYGGIQGHILADLNLTASVGIAEGNKIRTPGTKAFRSVSALSP
jgi:hypothetical protein